ncbi:hypothetical protein, partial [Phaeobacter sp. JH20_32]|uniref:hypothetical protein n=1 Tax=Phaeobacter sp. JH20_32 TaxID=3112489 RepID=UPI003A875ED6
AVDWVVNLLGGDIPNGLGTVMGGIGLVLGWIGFLGGVGFAILIGIAGGNELEQRRSQRQRFVEELRMQRNDYLRSSTD